MIDTRGPHVALVHTFICAKLMVLKKKTVIIAPVKNQPLGHHKWVAKCNKGCVSHYGFAIYIKKYLKAKEELWKLKYFTMQKYINFQKIL